MPTLPAWWSWRGLAEHVLVGFVFATILAQAGCAPFPNLLATLLMGIVHEFGDPSPHGHFTDFQPRNGGPWNGTLDVLTFVLGAALALWVFR